MPTKAFGRASISAAILLASLSVAIPSADGGTLSVNGIAFAADGDAATYEFDDSSCTFTLTGTGPYVLSGTNTAAVRIAASIPPTVRTTLSRESRWQTASRACRS